MRERYAHDAVLAMDADADARAPGAAITVGLCGHWQHEGPCQLAPHFTAVEHEGGEVRLRILFATEPENEAEVRTRIRAALSAGSLGEARWELRSDRASELRADEADHAARIAAS